MPNMTQLADWNISSVRPADPPWHLLFVTRFRQSKNNQSYELRFLRREEAELTWGKCEKRPIESDSSFKIYILIFFPPFSKRCLKLPTKPSASNFGWSGHVTWWKVWSVWLWNLWLQLQQGLQSSGGKNVWLFHCTEPKPLDFQFAQVGLWSRLSG